MGATADMSQNAHPLSTPGIAGVDELEDLLSTPSPGVVQMFKRVAGDIIFLGVGGKMGPSMARMARRAADAAGSARRIVGVSRFTSSQLPDQLRACNVEPIAADLLDSEQVKRLPDAPHVIFLAGMKFGSQGKQALTWAMNTFVPTLVAQKYRDSRIVALSTGNIYPMTPISSGGSVETDEPAPLGEYAMSCLGRERMFEHFSQTLGTRASIIRLNYAAEVRYGVLADLARRVWQNEPIDLATGNFNCIWQADANAHCLQSLEYAFSPPRVFNVTGPETLSVRRVCQQLGTIMGKAPAFVGAESPSAYLNNSQQANNLFGYPRVGIEQLITWVADWTQRGGATLNKPTHFETRDGKF